MKYTLHIGQSKTGTTALQDFLSRNRKKLREFGICYPDYYSGGVALNLENHNAFSESLTGHKRFPRFTAEKYFKQFNDQAEKFGCHTILLSAESFFGGHPRAWEIPPDRDYADMYGAKLQKLKSLIKEQPCVVVVYLRRQDERLESIIAHSIRYGGLTPHHTYESDEQIVQMDLPRMDYARTLEFWKNIVDPLEIIAVPYSKGLANGQDTIADFLGHLGLEPSDFVFPGLGHDEHRSLSAEIIEFKKILNRRPKSKNEERVTHFILNKLDDEIGSRRKYKIDPVLKQWVMSSLQHSNDLLADIYGESPGKPFFPSPETEKTLDKKSLPVDIAAIEDEFKRMRRTPQITILYIRISAARYLRKHSPFIHAVLRRIFHVLSRSGR